MRALFILSRQPGKAIDNWAASIQTNGTTAVKHTSTWSGPDCLQQRHGACADPFLLGSGATGSIESHLAQYHSCDALLLVSLDPAQPVLPLNGCALLIWQPQVPQDVVAQCLTLSQGLRDASCVKGLLLVEASPSLTLSVIHKALDAAGLQALARKPTVIVPRAAQAAAQALQQLADTLPAAAAPQSQLQLNPACGSSGVRVAVARDDAFGPCFKENLTLLQQVGAQLVFFSPLYDAVIPAGATCLYLSSGPLEPERWQQLATNRPLLAAVRAFCEAGGMVLAEGAGLLYLSRMVDLEEEEHTHQRHVHEMAGVLPFKTCLVPEPQTAPVEVCVAAGNPLLPAGSRLRGYLSAQANIVLVEERQLQSLILETLSHNASGPGGKGASSHFSTTYDVRVVQAQAQAQQQRPCAAPMTVAKAKGAERDDGVVAVVATADAGLGPAMPEGYAVNNVLASSCLLYLPSQPGIAMELLKRCACIDAVALAAGMAHHLGCSGMAPSASKLQLQLASSTCSRGSSRRQSIQDVSAWGAAYGSNSGISCGSSAAGMLADGWAHHQNHTSSHAASSHGHLAMHAASGGAGASPQHALPPTARGSGCALASGCVPPPRGGLYAATGMQHDSCCPPDGASRPVQRLPPKHSCAGSSQGHLGSAGCRPSYEHPGVITSGMGVGRPYLHLPQQAGSCGPTCEDNTCSRSGPNASAWGATADASDMLKSPPGRSPRLSCSTACEGACHGEHLPPVHEHSCSSYAAGHGHPTSTGENHFARAALHHAASDSSISAHGLGAGGCFPRASEDGPAALSRAGSVHGWSPPPAAAFRHGVAGMLGPLGAGAGHGGVVCCAPGACEALVAMGLGNRLAGVGSDCDYPPDVCSKHRVVFGWAAPEEAPQGAAARGIRVIHTVAGSSSNLAGAAAGCGAVGGAAARACRAGLDRAGARGGARVLLLDELALRQEPPAVLVLPDPAELSTAEQAQVEQALVETALVNPGGGPGGAGCILRASCHSLVDVMDLILELGSAAGEPHMASMLLERLQARLRRVQAAAAGAPVRPGIMAAAPAVAHSPVLASPPLPRCPRVLVLQSLQPLVEPGRWVPEMLAMVGATSCLALPSGPSVQLTWHDIRTRAAPDVLVILAPSGALSAGGTPAPPAHGGGAGAGSGGCSGSQGAAGLHEQLAALATQPGWWCLPAVRTSRVYLMESEYCVRAGPRLVDGVELLARLLMPGQYSSSRKAPSGAVMRLSLAAGQRCRATSLPSYFVPVALE